jgi:ribosomal protein L37AE/L43A
VGGGASTAVVGGNKKKIVKIKVGKDQNQAWVCSNCEEDEYFSRHSEGLSTCAPCNEIFDILDDIALTVATSEPIRSATNHNAVSAAEASEARTTAWNDSISTLRSQVLEYIAHKMEDSHQSHFRTRVLRLMRTDDNGERIYCIADYWMKLLPKKQKETTAESFGAKGMSVNGLSYILHPPQWWWDANSIEGEEKSGGEFILEHHQLVTQDKEQNSYHTIAGFEISLRIIKSTYSFAKFLHSTSDNASNYHSLLNLLLYPLVVRMAGLELEEHCFSVAGEGKNIGDTNGAHHTSKIRMAIASGHAATTPREVVTILNRKPLKGSKSEVINVNRAKQKGIERIVGEKKALGSKIKITNLMHWKFDSTDDTYYLYYYLDMGLATKIKLADLQKKMVGLGEYYLTGDSIRGTGSCVVKEEGDENVDESLGTLATHQSTTQTAHYIPATERALTRENKKLARQSKESKTALVARLKIEAYNDILRDANTAFPCPNA